MAHDWKPRGYVLEQVLGSGASADVWRARVAATGAAVAVKRVAVAGREQVRRAHREAALLMALDHPNLLRLHALVRAGDSLALVLDLAGNGSLRDLLRARGRLTPGETITALAPVAAAVSYLHSRSIVHGDVSSANILFTEAGTPLLGDVGVARISGDERDAESTPIYVDPVVAGGAVPDQSSDVFMLGAVAFHALTGQPLWAGDSAIAILARAVGGAPTDIADRLAAVGVPATMAEVIDRALDSHPHSRGSAAEFALDLRQCAAPTAIEFRAGRTVPGPVVLDHGPVGRHRAGDVSAEPGTYPSVPRQTRSLPGRPDFVRRGPPVTAAAGPTGRVTPEHPAPARARPDIPRRAVRASRSRAVVAGVLVLGAGVAMVVVSVAGRVHRSSAHPQSTTRAASTSPARSPATLPARPPATSTTASDPPSRWTQVLAGLDVIRAQAYAARRPELLARVYVPGALLADDSARLRRIVPHGCGLTGALTAYLSVTVVTSAGPRTVLTAAVALPRTRLVCNDLATRSAPAVPSRRMRIELTDTHDGPRIRDERLV